MTNQPKNNELIEKLASYMHDVRANRFLHQKYNCSDDNMDRREKQARTKYSKLSEEDKEKDRKFAREILDNLPKPTEVVVPVDIEDIIEKIGYIKRYSDTRYFDWEEAKKELKKLIIDNLPQSISREALEKLRDQYKERDKQEVTVEAGDVLKDLEKHLSTKEKVTPRDSMVEYLRGEKIVMAKYQTKYKTKQEVKAYNDGIKTAINMIASCRTFLEDFIP